MLHAKTREVGHSTTLQQQEQPRAVHTLPPIVFGVSCGLAHFRNCCFTAGAWSPERKLLRDSKYATQPVPLLSILSDPALLLLPSRVSRSLLAALLVVACCKSPPGSTQRQKRVP